MIGDLWDVDILGAYRAGIRAIWLNRYGATCPDANIATEINSFEPVEMVLDLVLKGRCANPSTAI
jgi:FMN phosphatase YigB (HAD superfamily)